MGEMNDKEQGVVYLSLLEKTLEKKADILDRLIDFTEQQKALITDDQLDFDQFNSIISEKSELITQINELDNGFEQLYQRVKDEMNATPQAFKTQIERLKKQITNVTDKGVKLQVLEKHNKEKLDSYISTKRENIRNFKVNSKTVSKYYSSIKNASADNSFFFDKKK